MNAKAARSKSKPTKSPRKPSLSRSKVATKAFEILTKLSLLIVGPILIAIGVALVCSGRGDEGYGLVSMGAGMLPYLLTRGNLFEPFRHKQRLAPWERMRRGGYDDDGDGIPDDLQGGGGLGPRDNFPYLLDPHNRDSEPHDNSGMSRGF